MASGLPVTVRAGAACTISYEVREARPTAVTCKLYEPDGTEITPAPTALLDDTNTFLTEDWVDGQRVYTIDETSTITRGRVYWIQGTRGVWEPVRCVGRGAGASEGQLYLADPPEESFLASDDPPLVSRRIYCEITAPTTRDERYYVEWSYTLTDEVTAATETRKERSYFHVVRQPWPEPFLRRDELRAILRGAADGDWQRTSERGEWFGEDVADACAVIQAKILRRNLKPWLYKSPEVFQRACAFEVLASWVRRDGYLPAGFSDLATATDHFGGLADQEFEAALELGELYDTDDTGVVTGDEATTPRGGFWMGL